MKNPLDRDEFEIYLEHEVNQHRMYPSDHIWRGIQQELHGHKKWPALTIITLFVISSLVVGTILVKPQMHAKTAAAYNTAKKALDNSSEALAKHQENIEEHLSPEHITQQTMAAVIADADVDIDNAIPGALEQYSGMQQLTPTNYTANTIDNAGPTAVAATNVEQGQMPIATKKSVLQNNFKSSINWSLATSMITMPNQNFVINGQLFNSGAVAKNKSYLKNDFMYSWPSISDLKFTTKGLNIESKVARLPGLASLKFKPAADKFDFQFYATPSISYRRLVNTEPGNSSRNYISGVPYGANYTVNTNGAVKHKPAPGYEIGSTIGYKVNGRLTVRTGVQFNMRQYDVDVYKVTNNPGNPPAANGSLGSSTALATSNVSSQQAAPPLQGTTVTLQNRYYEISVPVGIDWKAWKSGNFSWGLATSVQPTYIFNRDPFYIVSSDYKSGFVDGSKLLRNWNINTNFESYIGYTTGDFTWQIGPQFRYQVLPTLGGDYPVKEHLLDYGIKIGFVKKLP